MRSAIPFISTSLLTLAAACSSGNTELCGPGTINQDGSCIPAAATLSCGPGTTLVGNQCLNADGGTPITCGAGAVLVDGQCVRADAGAFCGPGTALLNGKCVARDAGPAIVCGAGTVLVGDACVSLDAGPGIVCGAGTVLVADACVRVDAGPGIVCGLGTVLVNGECVELDAGPGIVCGPNTVLVNGQCSPAQSSTVSVSLVGFGAGTVTGSGVVCANQVCSVTVADGTQVQLTGVPSPGYTFAGWRGGGCTGTGPCTITTNGNVALRAGFSGATFWQYANQLGTWTSGIYVVPSTGGSPSLIVAPGDSSLPVRWDYQLSRDGMEMLIAAPNPDTTYGLWLLDFWSSVSRSWSEGGTYDGAAGAAFSPDGTQLAWTSGNYPNYNLFTGKTSEFPMVNVTQYPLGTSVETQDCYTSSCATGRFVAWSPDGTRLAWVARGQPSPTSTNVWTALADGGDLTMLTLLVDAGVAGVDWSPDGTKVAFTALMALSDAGTGQVGDAGFASNLWTVEVTTGLLTPVTQFTAEYSLDIPTYARTGNAVVFASNEDPVTLTGDAGTSRNLFTIKDDGTGLRALTSSVVPSVFSWGPVWASDNVTLFFESNMDPSDAGVTLPQWGVWTLTLDAGVSGEIAYTDAGWDFTAIDDWD